MGNSASLRTCDLNNETARYIFNKHRLSIGLVSWEDNARNKNSALGPVISDVSLAVGNNSFPIIRPATNYTDPTTDMDISKFKVHVGNEERQSNHISNSMKCISLEKYLKNIEDYVNWTVKGESGLFLKRDSKILTSAQCCILPLTDGQVSFNVKIHNYQYDDQNPRVLCVVVSPHGTSAQLLTERNQSIYFNNRGKTASYVAKRLQDTRLEKGLSTNGPMTQEEKEENVLFVFQIPLKKKKKKKKKVRTKNNWYHMDECAYTECAYEEDAYEECASITTEYESKNNKSLSRGMDHAQLSVGMNTGEWTNGKKVVKIERDERYPIRCTIQYYRVTDTHDIVEEDIAQISEQVWKFYDHAPQSNKGSLVVDQTSSRITESSLPQRPVNKERFFEF